MPTSRKRTKKKTRQSRARQVNHARGRDCYELSGPNQLEQMEALRTPEDDQAYLEAADAEAAGDPALAIECLMRGLVVSGTPRILQLGELADLGDDAPSWALARWVVDQAYRWLLMEEDPRVSDAVLHTIAACYADVELDRPFGLSLREFGTRLGASDWVTDQLATFDLGGLRDFLDTRISDGLLARCGPIREWATTPIGGYRLSRTQDGVLDVVDLADGSRTKALDLGALFERAEGAYLGRLVPIDVEPGHMFESRPLRVDEETARAVAAAPDGLEWLEPLYRARTDGRLPLHFSHGQATPFMTDVVPMSWGSVCGDGDAGRAAEQEAPELDALRVNNLGVCELALRVARTSPQAIGTIGVSLHAVLTDRRTFEAARGHCVAPEHARRWRALARVVPEPSRSRCLELAELCEGDGVSRLASLAPQPPSVAPRPPSGA